MKMFSLGMYKSAGALASILAVPLLYSQVSQTCCEELLDLVVTAPGDLVECVGHRVKACDQPPGTPLVGKEFSALPMTLQCHTYTWNSQGMPALKTGCANDPVPGWTRVGKIGSTGDCCFVPSQGVTTLHENLPQPVLPCGKNACDRTTPPDPGDE